MKMAESSPFSKRLGNTVEKGEIARFLAIPPFPTVFSKELYSRHVKTGACLRKGLKQRTCNEQKTSMLSPPDDDVSKTSRRENYQFSQPR